MASQRLARRGSLQVIDGVWSEVVDDRTSHSSWAALRAAVARRTVVRLRLKIALIILTVCSGSPAIAFAESVTISKTGNLRSSPSTNDPILAKVQPGMRLKLLERVPNWYKVETPDLITGWVHKILLASSSTLPQQIDEALFFVVEAITDHSWADPGRWEARVTGLCTLRLYHLRSKNDHIPAVDIDLRDLDPDRVAWESFGFGGAYVSVQTTNLRNTIRSFKILIDENNRFQLYDEPRLGSVEAKDQFRVQLPRDYAGRVVKALSFAIKGCGGKTRW